MNVEHEWTHKGATLSDKTARTEYGLTQEEIIRAIHDGHLQFREGSMHGNPWFRLLRREVEALVRRKYGAASLANRQAATELATINRELKRLRKEIAELEKRKTRLTGS